MSEKNLAHLSFSETESGQAKLEVQGNTEPLVHLVTSCLREQEDLRSLFRLALLVIDRIEEEDSNQSSLN